MEWQIFLNLVPGVSGVSAAIGIGQFVFFNSLGVTFKEDILWK
jgi:hypothetical protein